MPGAAGTKPQNPDWTRDEHILALDLFPLFSGWSRCYFGLERRH
jgi:hypothetical protein